MTKLTLASLSILAAAALVTAGCGADTATSSKAATRTSPAVACPASWRAGWQRVADQIKAPVFCPSWMPNPLDARIHGVWNTVYSVSRDGSYLIGFAWQENGEEVHVNLRGYPGRTSIPRCRESNFAGGKVHYHVVPCFDDAAGTKRFGTLVATVFTVNQDADQWHILYAWRYRGALYTVSEHVALPFDTAAAVERNLDRMMRSLVRLEPRPQT
jgi:hypothetical protein